MGATTPTNKRFIKIDTSNELDFFTIWMTIMSPFLKLSKKELLLLTALVRRRYAILKDEGSEKLADLLLFTTEVRQELREEVGLSQTSFNNLLALLKTKGYISKDNIINAKVIPNVNLDNGEYNFHFNINILKDAR